MSTPDQAGPPAGLLWFVAAAGTFQALGAFQTGVGVAQVAAHPDVLFKHPAVAGLVGGVAAFVVGSTLPDCESVRDLVLRGYLAPVLLPAAAFLLLSHPADWEAVAERLLEFASRLRANTPNFVYAAATAYGCLCAQRRAEEKPGPPSFYR